jgi:hypothetical protein
MYVFYRQYICPPWLLCKLFFFFFVIYDYVLINVPDLLIHVSMFLVAKEKIVDECLPIRSNANI